MTRRAEPGSAESSSAAASAAESAAAARRGESRGAVTRLSASEIAAEIAAGRLSARAAVDAHIERIQAVDGLLNAVVVPLFEEAGAAARKADEDQALGRELGPLHGVPLTVKECFHVAGTPSSIGVQRLRDFRPTVDSPLVRQLRSSGAIVLGKTNVPQLMLLHETDNPVYGRTNNPWNLKRSPGGSTGGEAAIIAAGGSPLGLGSDLGGSIRQPAHSCGICGLKPTTGRLNGGGKRSNFRGMEAIGVQPGPMARSVADLELMLHVLMPLGAEGDFQVPPVPLGRAAAVCVPQLRVGVWEDDGFFSAAPALRRAVREAAEALRASGVTVVEFAPPAVIQVVRGYFGILGADGGADFRRTLGRDKPDWRIQRLLRLGSLPAVGRRHLSTLLQLSGQGRLADLVKHAGKASADHYWQLTAARADYTNRFIAALDEAGLDACLCPPHALPALLHGSTADLPSAASYSFLPNYLNMPAGVIAATRVRPGEESDRPASRDKVERSAIAVERGSAGLPVGVQVFGRHWREDVVLALLATLEAHFRQQADFPADPPL
jgi:fatty acid amide hydrolase